MDLFSSSNHTGPRRTVLLAPCYSRSVPKGFSALRCEPDEHARLLAEAQRLRGRVYLSDGAIGPWQLTESGRHIQAADRRSYHLLSLDEADEVVACTRYLPHSNTVPLTQLGVFHTPLGEDRDARPVLESAVEEELSRARDLGYGYVEMGGWAITEELRRTTEAVRMVVTIYALARMMGGALGISTVTTRHGSSSILRRLGGSTLRSGSGEVKTYYDPNYQCDMEILRFDSDSPSETFESAINRGQKMLAKTPVILPETVDMRVPMLAPMAAATA